ncbi:MAG: MFS transporter [Acidobacteria bacterium]|nr:MFS transporter [Acidobacteriota bacterium]
MSTATESQGLSLPLVLIMAAATGLAVASNYFAQPLLPTLAVDLHLSTAQAGGIVTTAQLGYATGLLFIVPLGDLFERRALITLMSVLSAAGLLTVALAPNLTLVLVGTALTGLFSVVAQILVPYAATLASPDQRGKVVGTVMSGLLLGILFARTVAGALTSLGTWRTVYFVGAGAMVGVAFVLRRALPKHHQPVDLSYFRLILSIFALFREEPVLRLRALLGAAAFGTFSVFWTSMAFLLAGPPHRLSPSSIGLFGLVGAAGALAASSAGRLADRGKGHWATGGGLALLLVSWVPLALVGRSMGVFLAGVLLLDFAIQGIHISNQAAIYRIRPEARNRLTAAYMTSYFLGGAAGSLASAAAFSRFGWLGVVVVGAAFSASGGVAWLLARGGAQPPTT